MKHAYGLIRGIPDKRRWRLDRLIPGAIELPPSIDLRPLMPPIYDQGQLGSCTANGIAAIFEYEQKRHGLTEFTPSRLFIYYNERAMEGSIPSDSGAVIADGIASVNKQGVCPETEWPYDISQFTIKPPDTAYADALNNTAVAYYSLDPDITQIKRALASGYPVVFGIAVYQSFEDTPDGHVPMPSPGEALLGGHCVVAVGYHNGTGRVICRNSWSANWGIKGYFTLPFSYVTDPDLTSDLWVISKVK